MAMQALSPEIVTLVHHIELNKGNWWNKGVRRLILATLWTSDSPLSVEEIRLALQNSFSVELTMECLQAELTALQSQGEIVVPRLGTVKITEKCREELSCEIDAANKLEREVETFFTATLGQHFAKPDRSSEWQEFKTSVLIPTIKTLGAYTYEALSGNRSRWQQDPHIERYLARFPKEAQASVRNSIICFLDPHNDKVRSYVLRQLNAYFFLEAGHLSKATISALTQSAQKKQTFNIFFDTNFLFSLLALHENPSNEAATSLLQLIDKVSKVLDIKMYVLPITLEEAKRVLIWHRDKLALLRLPPNLALVASEMDLTGFALKFIEETRKAEHTISAKDYFDPYITNLLAILEEKKIKLYNENLDRFTKKQEVLDDILGQMEYEKERKVKKPKSYEQHLHDTVIWYAIKGKRPTIMESPLGAGYWIVTIDYRLMGFDRFKRRHLTDDIPICVHPATLIQMLQFWVPRTQEFEEAVMGSFRLPFLFPDFDPDAEQVTIRILETLSRFEGIKDLAVPTARSVLYNNALRQKLHADTTSEQQIEYIKQALIDENLKLQEALKAKETENVSVVQDKEKAILEMGQKLQSVVDDNIKIREQYKASLSDQASLRSRLEELEARMTDARLSELKRKKIITYFLLWVAMPAIGLMFFLLIAIMLLMQRVRIGFIVLPWTCLELAHLWIAELIGKRENDICDDPRFRWFSARKKWLFGIIGVVVLGALANAFWEWLKACLS
jgi:hypothetical protein